MLILHNLSLQRGGKPLFANVSVTLHPGQRVGVIGANGSGKSSLFALLQNELQQDSGDLQQPAGWVVAHVAQETSALATAALDYTLAGDVELIQIEEALQAAENEHDGVKIAELHARFDAIDGYSARSRAQRLLAGLGFAQNQMSKPVAEFSGGWRVRLNLARALMCRSDLLLLDEPTNHLDLDAVVWLEQWLRAYSGTLLLISHDRDFLNGTVDHIIHIERQQLQLYRGDYSAFELQRAERLALQQAQYQTQQREIAHLQRFIDRFRAKATKARQAQSRIKALERLERISAAHIDSPFSFNLAPPQKLPNPLLDLNKIAVGYHEQPVLNNISLTIQPGTRLGLLGRNGAGKSTLIKLLAGQLHALTGDSLQTAADLQIGYFAQHQLEQLDPEASPLQHLQRLDDSVSEQIGRDFLGGFAFNGDKALTKVAPFSGGERARLALALIVWQRPNLLLLDEPTNHLDLEMRHALTLALQSFTGAMIIVSHDRHLLRTTCDAFLLVNNGQVKPFAGDLDDYKQWLNEQANAAGNQLNTAQNSEPPSTNKRDQRRQAAEQRNQLANKRRPLQKQLQTIEPRIATLETQKTKLETALTDPTLYEDSNKNKLKELLREQGEISRELSQLEEQWLELQEELEAIT